MGIIGLNIIIINIVTFIIAINFVFIAPSILVVIVLKTFPTKIIFFALIISVILILAIILVVVVTIAIVVIIIIVNVFIIIVLLVLATLIVSIIVFVINSVGKSSNFEYNFYWL